MAQLGGFGRLRRIYGLDWSALHGSEAEAAQRHLQQTPEPLLRPCQPGARDRPQFDNEARLLWAGGTHGVNSLP
jgi:hypothetical protein